MSGLPDYVKKGKSSREPEELLFMATTSGYMQEHRGF